MIGTPPRTAGRGVRLYVLAVQERHARAADNGHQAPALHYL
jgi:hypothetical protein